MENRLEGVHHLRVLGSAVAGPDGGGASLGESTRVDAETMAAAGGLRCLGPERRRQVDECRRWDFYIRVIQACATTDTDNLCAVVLEGYS
jgi:hypothetical protein